MIQVSRALRTFAKVKPLKIELTSSLTDPKYKFKSNTGDNQWQINNPLESLVSSLVGCELSTFKDFAKRQKLNVQSIKFTKIQGSYDTSNYMKGGKDNIINSINIEAEVETQGSQADIDKVHKKVENSCPVYNILNNAGVKVTNSWKKK